jgi:N-acetylmuramoyl-L-alanine amidase
MKRKLLAAAIIFAAVCALAAVCAALRPAPAVSAEPTAVPSPTPSAVQTPAPSPTPKQKIVVIDPGHQARADAGQEPIGPGASQTKQKVTGGTQGAATGTPEYELNLAVGLMLRDELESRGYKVIMTRTENDVDISNSQRAQTANDAGADIFVRIHANGSDDPSARGALTMCMTAQNPYNAELYAESRLLSEDILGALCASSGANSLGVAETDTMSGINWSDVPVTIVEMGFMTNPSEDTLMETEDYRNKIAIGIADGIDKYFEDMK